MTQISVSPGPQPKIPELPNFIHTGTGLSTLCYYPQVVLCFKTLKNPGHSTLKMKF